MKNKPIQSIGLTALFEARNSNLNSNESGAPKATAKHTYLSGQKVRYCLFATIDRLNRAEGDRGTMITNGDGINWNIQKDIRADLGGYLITGKKKDEADGEEDDVKNAKENSPVPAAFLNKRSGPLLVPTGTASTGTSRRTSGRTSEDT
jgi:CRISPR-associated protein Cas7/Csp1